MGVAISSGAELKPWLEGKPRAWAEVIALRCALRAAPLVFDPARYQRQSVDPSLALAVFRAMAVSSGAVKYPADDTVAAHATAAAVAANAAAVAANVAALAVNAADAPDSASRYAVYAIANAARAAAIDAAEEAAAFSPDRAAFWRAVSGDCDALDGGQTPKTLQAAPLWQDCPDWFDKSWADAARWLSGSGAGFEIWREWYLSRIKGLPHAFDRFDAMADEAFNRWIIEQDDDWWKRDPATVNDDIAAKVEALRRPAPPTDEELAQNPRAINFGPNTRGQVALAARRDPDKLDTSERARGRHAEVRANALKALEESRTGKTQATEIEPVLEGYLQSLGERPEDLDAPLLIARGEKLRRLISLRHDPKSSAVPFAEGQDGALADWLTSHNLFIGFDAYLSAVERIARGPDAVPTVLDLEALKRVIQSARDANLPTDDAAQALDDVADNVPPDPAPDDRRLVQATEALKNFIRAVGSLVKEHGWKVGLGGLGAAYGAASWVQRNIPWLRDVFGDEPSILSILESIAALPL